MNFVGYRWLNWQRTAAGKKGKQSALTQFLSADIPARGTPWQAVKYLAIDIETTGLNPMAHEIASIGWVAIERGAIRLASAGHQIVRTQSGVGSSATIHHITDTQASDGIALRHAMDQMLAACTGKVPVFHNASLDMAFINNACLRLYDAPFITPFVDTLQLERDKLLAQTALIGPGSLRLHACRDRYRLPDAPAHNALEDALATAELFIAWASHRAGEENLSWDEAV